MDDFLRGRNRKTASQIIAEAKASISTEGKVIIIVAAVIFLVTYRMNSILNQISKRERNQFLFISKPNFVTSIF